MDFLEYPEILKEEKGGMIPGRLKLTNQTIIFKNNKTGKVDQIQSSEIESIKWQRLAAAQGLRIMLQGGNMYRFAGFAETDHDKLGKFFQTNYEKELKNKEMCLKGWNWGTAKFQGSVLSFDVDKSTAFEVPLTNVSHCTSAKNEVTLEFHQNDDVPVSLMELRFHIPTDPNSSIDPVQAFVDNVLSKASIIQATGDAIVTFKELQCLTPRGRYDIKVFPTFIQLHGKTFDYKIPLTTILRLFLLPHKDNRQMFFVLSLDPPIKQGQTRYQFLILLFSKEEEITVDLSLSEEDIKEKYEDRLQKEMSGPTFEVISRVMKAIVQRKITVPGSFKGHSGTQAITCSYRAGNGLLYPLERGLIYVHKPPVHIRFDEIACVNFARSGGSTRSFDFEIEIKTGMVHTFSSIEKEEYGRLFDFVNSKKLRIKNCNLGLSTKEKPTYKEDLVDSDEEDEPDAYLQRVKAEGREREEGGGSTDEESSDESFAPEESGSEVAEEYDSNPPTSSDSDDDEEGSDKSSGDEYEQEAPKKVKEKKHKEPKKSKSAKTVKEPGMRKKRQKKERDENKPKRSPSAFILFLGDMREKIKKENPGITIKEIPKRAGEMWKETTDKSKWEEKAAELKKEYEKAMQEYKESGKSAAAEKVAKDQKTPKKDKDKKQSQSTKSPTKSPGSFKSKEYISSSSDSSDSEDKPLKKKKESDSDDDKMEIDEAASDSGSD
ncbi:FACT complex subunit SSRP1 [Trichonephila inaurata madagascariensis]|uniref:FACT complex subunit SSRP1 n=1 Tax=Trichonephila inaurata madagascariensis TaxID=2747483 RepID=A0A8X6Y9B5_9ARAC|nr:FACT complex subunit SSRP1 [Trichonephila inaurata madagascariensis]